MSAVAEITSADQKTSFRDLGAKRKIQPITSPVTYRWYNTKFVKADPKNRKFDRDRYLGGNLANVPEMDTIMVNDAQVEIHYYERAPVVMVGGAMTRLPKYKEIQFSRNGFLIVTPQQPNLYYYMELTNFNGGNKHRDPNKKVLFYRDDYINGKSNHVNVEREKGMVYKWLYSTANPDETELAAEALGVSLIRDGDGTKKDLDVLQYDIMKKLGPVNSPAEGKISFTAFRDMVENHQMRVISQIRLGEKKRILSYDPNLRRWMWTLGAGGAVSGIITGVSQTATNPRKELAMFFLAPPQINQDAYSVLTEKLGVEKDPEGSTTFDSLIEKAIEKGVITKGHFRWVWGPDKKGEEKIIGWASKGSPDPLMKLKDHLEGPDGAEDFDRMVREIE